MRLKCQAVQRYLPILLVATVLQVGCRPRPPAPQIDALASLLGPLPPDVRVLGGVSRLASGNLANDSNNGTSTWLLLSQTRLPTPTAGAKPATGKSGPSALASQEVVEQKDAFSAQVLYDAAAQLRVEPTLMPPMATQELAQGRGRIVEWSTGEKRVRVRELQLDHQWLSLVEAF